MPVNSQGKLITFSHEGKNYSFKEVIKSSEIGNKFVNLIENIRAVLYQNNEAACKNFRREMDHPEKGNI